MYIYLDESGNTNFDDPNDKYFFTGACITDIPVPDDLLIDAYDQLKADPEVTSESDLDCVNRGFFHASHDGTRAHIHAYTAINKIKNMDFYMSCFDKQLLKIEHDNNRRPLQAAPEFHRHVVRLSTTLSSSTRAATVNFIIAEREESLLSIHEENLRRELYECFVHHAIYFPMLATFFPEFSFSFVDGSNSGIQVCDFILWAARRKYYTHVNNCRWLSNIQIDKIDRIQEVDGAMSGVKFCINKPTRFYESSFPQYPIPFPKDKDYENETERVYDCLANIERKLHELRKLGLPAHTLRFSKELDEVCGMLESTSKIVSDQFVIACKLFLKLFDTVPLYPEDLEEMKAALGAKLWAALICRREEERAVRLGMHWARVRAEIFGRNKQALIP